jgi:hypothetical protein
MSAKMPRGQAGFSTGQATGHSLIKRFALPGLTGYQGNKVIFFNSGFLISGTVLFRHLNKNKNENDELEYFILIYYCFCYIKVPYPIGKDCVTDLFLRSRRPPNNRQTTLHPTRHRLHPRYAGNALYLELPSPEPRQQCAGDWAQPFGEKKEMATPELGLKHTCHECTAKYYDLNRAIVLCPKCGTKPLPVKAARVSQAAKAKARPAFRRFP